MDWYSWYLFTKNFCFSQIQNARSWQYHWRWLSWPPGPCRCGCSRRRCPSRSPGVQMLAWEGRCPSPWPCGTLGHFKIWLSNRFGSRFLDKLFCVSKDCYQSAQERPLFSRDGKAGEGQRNVWYQTWLFHYILKIFQVTQCTSASSCACCRRSATWAAMTRCRSAISVHLAHMQSRQPQYLIFHGKRQGVFESSLLTILPNANVIHCGVQQEKIVKQNILCKIMT